MLRQNSQKQWQALIGIPLKQPEGKFTVLVNNQAQHFVIQHFSYPKQYLTVQAKHVNPSKEQLARIQKELAQMKPVYESFSSPRPFTGMSWPILGQQSSGFGLKRFFNGEARDPHSGLDIAAPTGTPIMAPAAGKIVLVGDFYFNGKSIFIDHGQGLITMLCHLSRIDIKKGDEIKTGDAIGLVGSTGRVTGPHLHWTVSLNNARINPKLLLKDTSN
jgi:murein DD-endopeptidase MepM/ murein hydrolase activator NlpD